MRFSAPTPHGCSAFPFDRTATNAWVKDISLREGPELRRTCGMRAHNRVILLFGSTRTMLDG